MRRLRQLAIVLWAPILGLAWLFALPALGAETPTIGGYSLASTAAGATLVYNDLDLPIPASPTAEIETAYSTSNLNFGPVSHALASAAWPGSTIAEVGPALGLLFPIDPGVPAYPVRAESRFPATNGRAASQETNYPSTTMAARATPQKAQASVAIGAVEGPSALIRGAFASSVANQLTDHDGTSEGTATATDLDVMAGTLRIGSVRTYAKAVSNGKKATLSGGTVVADASVGGVPVVIDSTGVHASGQGGDTSALTAQVATVLAQAGIGLLLATPVDIRSGSSGERSVGGLTISFTGADLAKLPGGDTLSTYVNLNRTITLTLGSVLVRAAASPTDAVVAGVPIPPLPAAGSPSDESNPGSSPQVVSSNGGGSAQDGVTPPPAATPPSGQASPVSPPVLAGYLGSFRGIGGWILFGFIAVWLAGIAAMWRLNTALAAPAAGASGCSITTGRRTDAYEGNP